MSDPSSFQTERIRKSNDARVCDDVSGVVQTIIRLEHVVVQRVRHSFNSTHVSLAALQDKTRCSPHSKTSISNFLCLKSLNLSWVSLHESKRIKSKVTWGTVTRLTARGGSNSRYSLNHHNHDQTSSNVLWVRVPDLPESISLALSGGSFTSRSRSESFYLQETSDCQHSNTAVFDFSLTKPVEVNSNIVNVGKAQRVKTNITSHRSIEKCWSVHEGKSLALFSIQGSGRFCHLGRCKGCSRTGEEGEGGNLHHGVG
mmetsp:Transcript_29565/g.50401  ORF Transcript_29565/g.50401 Transcript_29565/m.50401 type:complete len:257 (+) Transcript_29565:198-968(+)